MSYKTIAIFINDNDSIEAISVLYDFFHKDYEDFVIVSNENNKIKTQYAVIPSIHLKFLKASIVFLSAKSYLEKQDILSNDIYVLTSVDEMLSNNIPKNRLSGIKIITLEDKTIEVIKYDKLQ
jgi:hypothetical protein